MIPRWVERYLTIPFADKGRGESGCDCFGLVRLVLEREAGIVIPDYGWVESASGVAVSNAIRGACSDPDDVWQPLPACSARMLDVVPMASLVRFQDNRLQMAEAHVGIMVSETHVLHSERESGPACVPLTAREIVRRLLPRNAPVVRRHRTLSCTN